MFSPTATSFLRQTNTISSSSSPAQHTARQGVVKSKTTPSKKKLSIFYYSFCDSRLGIKLPFFPHFILFSSYPCASFLSSQDPRFHAHETHTLTCRRLRCTLTLAQIHWNCFIIKKLLPRLPRKSTRRTQKMHFSPPKHNRSGPTPLKIESRQSTAPFVTQFDTKLAVQNVKKCQNIRT